VICCAGLGALCLTSSSIGAITPRLVVTTGGDGRLLSISAASQPGDDQVGRLQMFVPAGFTLASPTVGAPVGTATATVASHSSGSTTTRAMTGTVVAIDPSDPTVGYENANCDPGSHLAAWSVRLKSGSHAYTFPIFVDAPADPVSSFASYVLTACFRPADLAATDPNRSPEGDALQSFTLAPNVFGTPAAPGTFLWRSLWTAFGAGTGALNGTASGEAQSTTVVPNGQLDLEAAKSSLLVQRKAVPVAVVSGQVSVAGQPQPNVLVRLRRGAGPSAMHVLTRVRTGVAGEFAAVALLTGPTAFQAVADIPAKDLGTAGCQSSFAGIPCLDATGGAVRLTSAVVTVKR
jgi:hypothetical protein